MPTKRSVLAIDPGHRAFGMAHFVGSQLADFGVKSLRRAGRTNTAVLKEVMVRMVKEKRPDLIALALNTIAIGGGRDPLMIVMQQLQQFAVEHGKPVYGFVAGTVKEAVCGDGRATRRSIAEAVTAQFPELRAYVSADRRWRERYYQHLFAAVAVALTYQKMAEAGRLTDYEITHEEINA